MQKTSVYDLKENILIKSFGYPLDMQYPHTPCDSSCKGKWQDGQILKEGIDYRLMDSNIYYRCECNKCGWIDSSQFAAGGESIADTGDYEDARCPQCNNKNVDANSDSYKGIIAIPISKSNNNLNQK